MLELDSGERIAQSSAILWYLAEGTPFLPDDALGARAGRSSGCRSSRSA